MDQQTIAGFPVEAWNRFLKPIDKRLVSKDPNGLDYVAHQVCIEMLNECFGPDGWWQEVVQTWFHEGYTYATRNGDKSGRAFAEAQVKLCIGKPGSDAVVCRENIGSQVAGGDWSEARKGAVSEALKRAASLFGWAGNVYKTERLGGHDDAPAQQAAPAPATPDPADIVDLATCQAGLLALGIRTKAAVAQAMADAGLGEYKMSQLDPEALRAIYATALAKRRPQEAAA